jgi:hypothetical protein
MKPLYLCLLFFGFSGVILFNAYATQEKKPLEESSTIIADENLESHEESQNLNTTYAQLQWVDKVTGRFKLIQAKVGKTITYQTLKINVNVCRQSAPFEAPESKSFMTIWEYPIEGLPKKLFSGWMFASSPVLSTLVNHPRYNVWLVKCTNENMNAKPKMSVNN